MCSILIPYEKIVPLRLWWIAKPTNPLQPLSWTLLSNARLTNRRKANIIAMFFGGGSVLRFRSSPLPLSCQYYLGFIFTRTISHMFQITASFHLVVELFKWKRCSSAPIRSQDRWRWSGQLLAKRTRYVVGETWLPVRMLTSSSISTQGFFYFRPLAFINILYFAATS